MRHPSTPEQRVEWTAHVIAHQGEYGVVTRLARAKKVSRQTLTTWRREGRAALERAMAEDPPPPPVPSLERSIVTLVVDGHTSYRGVQTCLHELFGWNVSLGTITSVVATAGRRGATELASMTPPAPIALALDEIYGGAARHGYLNAVDVRSGMVMAADGPLVPSKAAWQEMLESLDAQGVQWSSAVHDGGNAAAGGVIAVTPDVPRQRDIWHLLHRCAQAQARIERLVSAAEQKWESAERYAATIAAGGKPRYRPPAMAAAQQAEVVDTLAQTAINLRLLTGELQRLLAVVVVDGNRVLDCAKRAADVAIVVNLVEELARTAPSVAQSEIIVLHRALVEAIDGVQVFTTTLEPIHRDMAVRLGEAGVALAGWAWLRRTILGDGEDLVTQFPDAWRPAIRVLLSAWTGAVRASSAVEGWHSVLRPHLAVHRSLPRPLLALLAVAHNHRIAPRGIHAGASPLQRGGFPEATGDWLTILDDHEALPSAPTPHRATRHQRLAA